MCNNLIPLRGGDIHSACLKYSKRIPGNDQLIFKQKPLKITVAGNPLLGGVGVGLNKSYCARNDTFCRAAFTDGTQDASKAITKTVSITNKTSVRKISTG